MDIFEENGDALDRLMAHGSLGCGKLKSVGDFVRKVCGVEGVGLNFAIRWVDLFRFLETDNLISRTA